MTFCIVTISKVLHGQVPPGWKSKHPEEKLVVRSQTGDNPEDMTLNMKRLFEGRYGNWFIFRKAEQLQ